MKASGSNLLVWLAGLATLAVLSIGLLMPLLQPATGSSRALPRSAPAARIDAGAAKIPPAVAAAARLPRDVDWVIVLEDAEGMSQTAVGAALATLFRGSGTDGASFEMVWNGLAKQLEWDPRETFNRLIGRRVVFVARGIERGETARWALLSQVSLATDLRLKERLQAAPREIDSGLPILSLENGMYELTSHLNPPGAGDADQGEVTLIIGPAGRTELFDQMVRSVSQGLSQTLADQDVISVAGKLGDSQILVLHRVAGSLGSAAAAPPGETGEWTNFIAACARADVTDQSKLVTRLIYRNVAQRDVNVRLQECSSDVFESMKEGSVLTIMQAAPLQQVLGGWASIIDAIRDLPVPDRARGFVGQRVAVSLRQADTSAGQESAVGQLAATVALEAKSAADLAKSMDGSISRFVRAIEQSGDSDPPPVDFAGELPALVRVQPVKMSSNSPLRSFVSGPMAMAWSYPVAAPTQDADAAADVQADQAPRGEKSTAGWCVVTASPTPAGREDLPAQVHREVVGRLTSGHPAAARNRWIWLTWVKPAELDRLLTGNVPLAGLPKEVPSSSYRALVRAADELDFRLSVTREGDIEGEVTLKLFPPPPRPAEPGVSPAPSPATQP